MHALRFAAAARNFHEVALVLVLLFFLKIVSSVHGKGQECSPVYGGTVC